ncbi:MAG: branched-chain amino acid ABC transporter permease [Thermomicrobiales bacterium]
MDAGRLAVLIFNGLVTGSFYAVIALGLAIIFGMMRVVNFAHGAFYMLGAFGAYILLDQWHIGFWWALVLAPLVIGAVGMVLERLLFRRLYHLDPLYNFLLSFAVATIIQDAMRLRYSVQGKPYRVTSPLLAGVKHIGPTFYPTYRLFVILFSVIICIAVWFIIERTRIGMVVRAATEKPALTRALGVNVDRWITPVFGFGVALAALGGVLAAPMQQVKPSMGEDLIIVIFAVVVIGGMGSIAGSVVAGLTIGVVAAVGEAYYSQISSTLVFIVMAIVLLVRPAGLFGSVEAT